MPRQSYPGLANPLSAFPELAPAHDKLMAMASRYHPADAQHHALVHAAMTMRTAAELITRQPHYRGIGSTDTGSVGSTRVDGKMDSATGRVIP